MSVLRTPVNAGRFAERSKGHRFLSREICVACWGASVALALGASGQQQPDPVAGAEPGSATVYSEESIGDVDPRGVSTRWIDPAQAGDLMRDRVIRTRPLTPAQAAAAGLNPRLGATRGYAYRAPGVRASFHRPAYLTWTLDGPRVNGNASREGGFREIIPPDTVFDLTPPTVPTSELTAFSAGMLVDGRLPLARSNTRSSASALGPSRRAALPVPAQPPAASSPRSLQPWVRLEFDETGRARLAEPAAADP